MSITTLIPRAFKYLTADEKKRRETKIMIREIMMTITHDTVLLGEVIARGPVEWRNKFLTEMRGMSVDSHIADLVYVGFCKSWKAQFGDISVPEVLSKIEVRTPLTEAEIDAAWEHDASSSSWDARRRFYRDYPSKLPIEIRTSGGGAAAADTAPAPSGTSKGVH